LTTRNALFMRLSHAGLGLACLAMAGAVQAGTLNALVLTPNGVPLPLAVISATPLGQAPMTVKPGSKAVMIQESRQFKPFILPVQLGTTVEFPNRDTFRHHIYSFAAAKIFELKLHGTAVVGSVTFDKEGVVPLGCNIHDNMLAYIYVVGTPHFTTTADSGQGSLSRLPAGEYAVKVWHPNQKAGQGDAGTVHIGATDTADITVTIDVKRARALRKPDAVDENEY